MELKEAHNVHPGGVRARGRNDGVYGKLYGTGSNLADSSNSSKPDINYLTDSRGGAKVRLPLASASSNRLILLLFCSGLRSGNILGNMAAE